MPLRNNGSAGFRAWPPETGRRRLVAGALLLVTTSACAADESPRQAPSRGITSVSQLVLPFDAYKTTPEQRAILDNAHNHLVVRCMSKQGIAIKPPAQNKQDLAARDPGNSRRYGVADTEVAKRNGYHLASSTAPDTTTAWAEKLPKPARHRLYGTATQQGCVDHATSTMDKGARKADWPWLSLQDSLTLEQAAKHPSVIEAMKRWQSCMSGQGHSYPDPEAAIADSRWNLEKPDVTEDEKQTAITDTRCKWSSGLIRAWYAADLELQRAIVRDNADRFTALRDNLEHRLREASRLVSEDEGGQVR
ncbi:hypothetical protein ACFOY2_31615 [Nonomuraea purpurea]|uniref:Lipoprotein n=1 Tax=Nonomuraea purpurea TaxID=1849276 RepID=A0ABV8GGE9_9ACTN